MPVIPASALSLADACLVDAGQLDLALARDGVSLHVIAVEACDSTNALLAGPRPLHSDCIESAPVFCVADRQIAGRGRRGRTWVSSPEGSLTFSLAWSFSRKTDLSGLSLAVGLALRRGLARMGFGAVRLKWPNDLLVPMESSGYAKVGGILIELSAQGDNNRAVVGVGINLRSPDSTALTGAVGPAAQPAAGLDAIGALPARIDLLAALAGELCRAMIDFAQRGFAPLRDEWNDVHAFAGQDVVLHAENDARTCGRCLGVDADGCLRVRTDRAELRWLAGDVSLRPAGATP